MQKKKTLRRGILLFTAVLLLFSMALMTGCGKEEEEDENAYDVVLQIKDSRGISYYYELGLDNIEIAYPYTGKEVTFEMEAYNLPDHPTESEEWQAPNTTWENEISVVATYTDEEGNVTENVPTVTLAKGRYHFQYTTSSGRGYFRQRIMDFYITIYYGGVLSYSLDQV